MSSVDNSNRQVTSDCCNTELSNSEYTFQDKLQMAFSIPAGFGSKEIPSSSHPKDTTGD